MIMQGILNATAVRQDFSQFVDTVVRERPQAVKRNRDMFWSISHEMLVDLLKDFTLAIEYEKEEDGSYVGSLLQIKDIIAYGDTYEEMLEDAALQLEEYAHEYIEDFTKYYNTPNRKSHFPFILNVLNQDDLEGIKKIIG